jgi:hypothetical protein
MAARAFPCPTSVFSSIRSLSPHFFFLASLLEFGLILGGILAVLFCQFYLFFKKRKKHRTQKTLNELIEKATFNQLPLNLADIPPNCLNIESLLLVLENFNQRFSDQNWQITKFNLVHGYLKPATKNWISSSFWSKRSRAIRCIFLSPQLQDSLALHTFLDDKSYYIRSLAAFAAIALEQPSLTYAVLKRMGSEHKHARYAYRSAILHSQSKVFNQVLDIYKQDPEEEVRLACLDVFSFRVIPHLFSFIQKDLSSHNLDIKLTATQLLANLPDLRAIETLEAYLEDPHWMIRAEAAKNLGNLQARGAINQLEKCLSDPVWTVRLQAGLALKQLGNEGRHILETQDWDLNADAYEIARFLLTNPQG